MPPAPSADTISYGPSLVPGLRAMAEDYRRLKTAAHPKYLGACPNLASRKLGWGVSPNAVGGELPIIYSASDADVAGLRSLGTLRSLELDVVAFFQRFESSSLDRAEVHEQIFSAVIGSDEPESLCIVKPLHSTLCHF